MSWRIFLFYNLTGSTAYTISYILMGYLFGRKWNLFEAWLGCTVIDLIVAGIALVALGIVFRKSLSGYLPRHWSTKRPRR